MRRDWLLVGSDIRLRAGVLSHWLRGRQPTMTAEAFQNRWCHGEVLCSRPAEVTEPPRMHWTAAHPVPLFFFVSFGEETLHVGQYRQ